MSGELFWHAKTKLTIGISCHQPRRPVSCIRRQPTAIDGKNKAAEAMESSPAPESATETMTVNSVHHQNSLRDARPLKFA